MKRLSVRRLLAVFVALPVAAPAVVATASPARAGPGDVSEINHNASGKCIDVATQNNVTVELWNCTNHLAQSWIYGQPTIIGGIRYIQILNRNKPTCLDVAGSSMDASVPAQARPCSSSESQLWAPFYAGSSTLSTLHNKHSGLCLDLLNNNSSNGMIIQQYPCNGSAAQVWREDSGW